MAGKTARKTRLLLGMRILRLTRQITPGSFEYETYNPEDGNFYFGRLELINANAVRLTGCTFVILPQSQDWARAPEIVDETPVLGTARMLLPLIMPAPAPMQQRPRQTARRSRVSC